MTAIDRELAAELLAEIRHLNATTTAAVARFAGRSTNGVLDSFTDQLDTDGRLKRSYGTAIGSIVVINNTGATLTVYAGDTTSAAAPTKGVGVIVLPSSSFMTIPVDHHAFTLYGTAAGQVSVMVFSGLQPFGVSL